MSIRLAWIAFVLAPMFSAAAQEPDHPKIISKAIKTGHLVTTRKIGLTDGLFMSISFVVLDPSRPAAQTLEQGLAGIVFIENHIPTKDYKLSRKTRVKLIRGGKQFTLLDPEEKVVNAYVKAADFETLIAADLLAFLKSDGKMSVEVDGKKYELSDYWNENMVDLVNEVEKQRRSISRKK